MSVPWLVKMRVMCRTWSALGYLAVAAWVVLDDLLFGACFRPGKVACRGVGHRGGWVQSMPGQQDA